MDAYTILLFIMNVCFAYIGFTSNSRFDHLLGWFNLVAACGLVMVLVLPLIG